MSEGQPAWIELQWQQPQRIRQIQMTFDSGFRRQLTLTAQDSQNRGIVRAAQPETIRDYSISCGTPDGQSRKLETIKNNFQRVNRHDFEPVDAKTVRIEVQATNGIDQARIFEIRCYA